MKLIEDKITVTELKKMADKIGINLHLYENEEKFIEYDSMINLRPSWGNKTRGVDDIKVREKIVRIVYKLVK